jgi:hypothetical protein
MTTVRTMQALTVPLAAIGEHPDNPRDTLGDLAELTASIGELGLLQALLGGGLSDPGEMFRPLLELPIVGQIPLQNITIDREHT